MFFETSYNLGELGGSKVGQVVGTGGGFAGSIIPLVSTAAWAGPVGAAVGIVAGIIAGIFARHAAKVAREDEVTGVWAQTGQQAIAQTMALYRSGDASAAEVIAGLQSIEEQFKQLTSDVVKTNGKFGVFPNPEAPRPSNNCNASCGLYWELHQQIKGLIAEVQAGGDKGGISSLFGSSGGGSKLPLLLVAGLALWALS